MSADDAGKMAPGTAPIFEVLTREQQSRFYEINEHSEACRCALYILRHLFFWSASHSAIMSGLVLLLGFADSQHHNREFLLDKDEDYCTNFWASDSLLIRGARAASFLLRGLKTPSAPTAFFPRFFSFQTGWTASGSACGWTCRCGCCGRPRSSASAQSRLRAS